MAELLVHYGASVDIAVRNEDGIRLLASGPYDVVISDVARDNEGVGGDLKGVELARCPAFSACQACAPQHPDGL